MPDKVALVTGGSGAIGFACCQALSNLGFKIVLHYKSSQEKAEKLASTLQNVELLQANLEQTDDIDKVYNYFKTSQSGNIDVLVNNAGIAIDNPFFSASLKDYEMTMNTNTRATWYLTKRLSRFMIRKKAGRIINISSVIGSIPNPTQSIYSMSKAAINAFTRTVALEMAPYNILVNSVAPGFIESDMTVNTIKGEHKDMVLNNIPLHRIGQPEEVAQCVAFLSNSATYCTGSVLHVNGGLFCNS